jgi:transcriptional regulator with XRE-family HTH domain
VIKVNERIKQVRKQLGLSQQEISKKLGTPQQTVANIELGKVPVSNEKISNYCFRLGVSEEWLRTGEGRMFTEPTPEERKELDIKEVVEIYNSLSDRLKKLCDKIVMEIVEFRNSI